MKIKRFNENTVGVIIPAQFIPSNDDQMLSYISSLMLDHLDMKLIPYTDNDYEIDQESVYEAAKRIFQELKKFGVDFDLIYTTKKYNL